MRHYNMGTCYIYAIFVLNILWMRHYNMGTCYIYAIFVLVATKRNPRKCFLKVRERNITVMSKSLKCNKIARMSCTTFHGIWHDVSLGVNQGTGKIIFGSGTKVIVESREFQIFCFIKTVLVIKFKISGHNEHT